MQITHDPGLIMRPENPHRTAKTRPAGHGAHLLQRDEAVRIQIIIGISQRLLHHEVIPLLIYADDFGGMGTRIMQDNEFFHRLHQQRITHGHLKTLAVWVTLDLEGLAEAASGMKREKFINDQPVRVGKRTGFSACFEWLEGARAEDGVLIAIEAEVFQTD